MFLFCFGGARVGLPGLFGSGRAKVGLPGLFGSGRAKVGLPGLFGSGRAKVGLPGLIVGFESGLATLERIGELSQDLGELVDADGAENLLAPSFARDHASIAQYPEVARDDRHVEWLISRQLTHRTGATGLGQANDQARAARVAERLEDPGDEVPGERAATRCGHWLGLSTVVRLRHSANI
jgi:hypothetical protein